MMFEPFYLSTKFHLAPLAHEKLLTHCWSFTNFSSWSTKFLLSLIHLRPPRRNSVMSRLNSLHNLRKCCYSLHQNKAVKPLLFFRSNDADPLDYQISCHWLAIETGRLQDYSCTLIRFRYICLILAAEPWVVTLDLLKLYVKSYQARAVRLMCWQRHLNVVFRKHSQLLRSLILSLKSSCTDDSIFF